MADFIKVIDYHTGAELLDVSTGGVVVFDIDGTVADITHRRSYVAKRPKQWGKFFAGMSQDMPLEFQRDIALALAADPRWTVLFCTGRSEEHRTVTVDWLEQHGMSYVELYMRRDGDRRPDTLVKLELLARMRKDGYDPTLVFEDRKRVVAMWRGSGIKCVQVDEGDF